jgi:prevent-host-death family protein
MVSSVVTGFFSGSLIVAIIYGYNNTMKVSTATARNRFTELLRAVESGERVVITRHGKPVAQIAPLPRETRRVQLGGMKGRIRLLPGWDKPIDPDRFLEGEL